MAEGYSEVQCPGGQPGTGGYPYGEVPCPKERAWSRVVQCIQCINTNILALKIFQIMTNSVL